MSRFSSHAWIPWTCLALGCLVGCGRFGFDELRLGATRPQQGMGGKDGGAGDGKDGGASDGGQLPIEGGDGSTSPPLSDAGVQPVDAALPEPDLLPLPRDIVCSSLTRVVACDNFSGSANGVLVSTERRGAGASVATDELFHGRIKTTQEAANVVAAFTPVSSSSLFLRFNAFVPSSFPLEGITLASLAEADGAGSSDFALDLNLVNDGHVEMTTSGNGEVNTTSSRYILPRDRWLCVQLELTDIRNLASSVRLWIDNRLTLSATRIDTSFSIGVTRARVGINRAFFNQGPAAVYVDNFVLARDPPGDCP